MRAISNLIFEYGATTSDLPDWQALRSRVRKSEMGSVSALMLY
jgi:hypothetical protein